MEQALRKMWEIWCNGEAPRVFEVTSDKTYDLSNIGVETDLLPKNQKYISKKENHATISAVDD